MSLFDSDLGAFRILETTELHLGDQTMWRSGVRINPYDGLPLQGSFTYCGGLSRDRELSLVKAKAEAIERYTMSLSRQKAQKQMFPIGYDEIKDRLQIMWLDGAPSLEDVKGAINWVLLSNLLGDKQVHVPEQLVNFNVTRLDVPLQITPISSNGFSAHLDIPRAYMNGILECVERDVVLRAWLTLDGIKTLPFRSISCEDRQLIQYLQGENWKIALNVLVNEFDIPTVWIIGYKPGLKVGNVLVGAKSAVTIQDAASGAIMEFLSNYGVEVQSNNIENCDHEEIVELMAYLSKQPEYRNEPNLAICKDYQELAIRINATRNTECLGTEFTLPEIEPEGYKVVKVVIPGLLYFSERPTVEAVRLYSAQRKFDHLKSNGLMSFYL